MTRRRADRRRGTIRHPALLCVIVIIVVALGLSACGGESSTTSPSSPGASPTTSQTTTNIYLEQRTAGVRDLLTSLSRVLTDGTPADLDALVDSSATPAFRAGLHTVQANLSAAVFRAGPARPPRGTRLVLRDFRYQPAPTEEAETQVDADVRQRLDEQGSADDWVAPVEIHSALGGAANPGIDEDPVVVTTQLVVARYGDDWKVVGDATLVGEPAPPTQLWNVPGLAASDVPTLGGTSVIGSYPDTGPLVERVGRLLPGAVRAVTAWWGPRWPRRAVVVTTATDDEFQALAGTASDTGAAAATIYAHLDLSAASATGQRIVLTPEVADLPDPALEVVLRHELTHVATRAQTAPTAPMWITEGVPEYVGRKGTYTRLEDAAPDLAAAVRSGRTPAGLPADEQFAVGSDASRLAYQTAWSMAAFVAGRFGEEKLKSLYVGVAASGEQARQDAAIAATLGIPRDTLVGQWRAWLTRELR
ncbi:hypothetical protein ACWDPV_15480 [Gordonia sp. NPDC003504]